MKPILIYLFETIINCVFLMPLKQTLCFCYVCTFTIYFTHPIQTCFNMKLQPIYTKFLKFNCATLHAAHHQQHVMKTLAVRLFGSLFKFNFMILNAFLTSSLTHSPSLSPYKTNEISTAVGVMFFFFCNSSLFFTQFLKWSNLKCITDRQRERVACVCVFFPLILENRYLEHTGVLHRILLESNLVKGL